MNVAVVDSFDKYSFQISLDEMSDVFIQFRPTVEIKPDQ